MYSTTEITSAEIISDNPVHQRLFFAYLHASKMLHGDLLEVGCGVGRGLSVMLDACDTYTAIDKNEKLVNQLQEQYSLENGYKFIHQNIPPFDGIEDNSFDFVVTFQVIEHIQDDELFVKEIHRVLKPGGKAIFSTPNIKLSLTRNPWHTREYTAQQLKDLLSMYSNVEAKGIHGNDKVMAYYEENKHAVSKFKKLDILNMEQWLPRSILRIPYDFLNRRNRKKLMVQDNSLASDILVDDYYVEENPDTSLDLFYIATK